MRDLVYFTHILAGLLLAILPFAVLYLMDKKDSLFKSAAAATAFLGWLLLLPAGFLYTQFYPATKTLIKAGANPWAHSVIMETKEHWGILLPVLATTAAVLVFQGKEKESRRWFMLVAVLAILLGVMGRIITWGAGK